MEITLQMISDQATGIPMRTAGGVDLDARALPVLPLRFKHACQFEAAKTPRRERGGCKRSAMMASSYTGIRSGGGSQYGMLAQLL